MIFFQAMETDFGHYDRDNRSLAFKNSSESRRKIYLRNDPRRRGRIQIEGFLKKLQDE